MKTFLILLGVALLGVIAFIFIRRNSVDFSKLGPPPPITKDCGALANFFGGHEGRKNALAPSIIKNYAGVSDGQAQQIAAIASKLSPSAYAEKFVGEKLSSWLCGKSFS